MKSYLSLFDLPGEYGFNLLSVDLSEFGLQILVLVRHLMQEESNFRFFFFFFFFFFF